jgi:hypothetical protein
MSQVGGNVQRKLEPLVAARMFVLEVSDFSESRSQPTTPQVVNEHPQKVDLYPRTTVGRNERFRADAVFSGLQKVRGFGIFSLWHLGPLYCSGIRKDLEISCSGAA